MDFIGFDSSILLIVRGGIPRPIGKFPGKFEPSNLSRDNVSRETGRRQAGRKEGRQAAQAAQQQGSQTARHRAGRANNLYHRCFCFIPRPRS